MNSRGEIVRQWREAQGLNTRQLADAVGTSRQNIENLEANLVDQPRYLPKLAKVMGYASTDDLLALRNPPPIQGGLAQVAHLMRPLAASIEQIVSMLWEELMGVKTKGELPPLIQVAAPDNAMAPRLRQGVKATFERDLVPQFGDGVLVKDNAGELHIRYYRRGRPGTWEAHAESEDYAPLLSDRDGLEIWAVLTAVAGRWA